MYLPSHAKFGACWVKRSGYVQICGQICGFLHQRMTVPVKLKFGVDGITIKPLNTKTVLISLDRGKFVLVKVCLILSLHH